MALWSTWVVFCFELRRALRPGRLLLSAVMAVFPAAFFAVLQSQGGKLDLSLPARSIVLFVLIPQVLCLLGLLLWATPAIQTEIDGKTWVYLAVRPGGKTAILLGKYAVAVLRSIVTSLAALTLCMCVLYGTDRLLKLWAVFAALVVLASLAYAAVFLLLGVFFRRRGMAVAVAYVFLVDVALAILPATVNKFTVQYHLRSLMVDWMGLLNDTVPPQVRQLVAWGEPWQHIAILLALAAAALSLAALVLNRREWIVVAE